LFAGAPPDDCIALISGDTRDGDKNVKIKCDCFEASENPVAIFGGQDQNAVPKWARRVVDCFVACSAGGSLGWLFHPGDLTLTMCIHPGPSGRIILCNSHLMMALAEIAPVAEPSVTSVWKRKTPGTSDGHVGRFLFELQGSRGGRLRTVVLDLHDHWRRLRRTLSWSARRNRQAHLRTPISSSPTSYSGG
jgi:hypothetical protein